MTVKREPSAPRARQGWAMKDLMLTVVLGVVFGFAYWALVQGWNAMSILMGPGGDLSQHILFGGWLLVAPIAVAIIRRPFVGVIAEILAAVVEVIFLGSPVGPTLLIAAAIQGAGSELPFALTRYKRFGWAVFALSGLLGAGAVFFYSAFRFGWYGQDIFFLRLGLQALSGVVLGGLLAKVIVDALAHTGVVDNFAIDDWRARPLRPTTANAERPRPSTAAPRPPSATAPAKTGDSLTDCAGRSRSGSLPRTIVDVATVCSATEPLSSFRWVDSHGQCNG